MEAGFLNGLTQGAAQGFGLVSDARHRSREADRRDRQEEFRREQAEQRRQRQERAFEFQQERFDANQENRDRTFGLQRERFDATQENRDRTFNLKQEAAERERQQEALGTLYRMMGQENPNLDSINQYVQTHSDALDSFIPGAGRHPVGIAPTDDDPNAYTALIYNEETDTVGPMQEGGSTDDGDPVMTFTRDDLAAMAGLEKSDDKYGEIQQHPQLGIGQFDANGQWHPLESGAGAPSESAGGGIEYGSTEYKRVMDMVDRGTNRIYTTHLGAEFMGDPQNAQLRSMADQVAIGAVEAGQRQGVQVNPQVAGSVAASQSLSIDGLNPDRALEMAEEEMGTGWNGADDSDIEARAFEIQQQAQQQLAQSVMQTLLGDQRQPGGLPAESAQPPGQTPRPEQDRAPAPAPEESAETRRRSSGAVGVPGAVSVPDAAASPIPDNNDQRIRPRGLAPGASLGDEPVTPGNEDSAGVGVRNWAEDKINQGRLLFGLGTDMLRNDGMTSEAIESATEPVTEPVNRFVNDLRTGEREAVPDAVNQFAQAWKGGQMPDKATTRAAAEWVMNNKGRASPEMKRALAQAAREHNL